MNFTRLLFAVLFCSTFSLSAQQNIIQDDHEHKDEFYLPLEFDKDSLQGFNEDAAWQQASMNADKDWKKARIVAILKRNYIDFKYGFLAAAPIPVVQGPCSNPDFETGTIAGWTASQSPNNNSITMLPFTGAATTQAVLVTAGNDPNVGAALQQVPAGSGIYTCRLGPTGMTNGGKSYRMAQSFTVTPANSVFIYKYAVVLNSGSPHICSEQPFFNVSFKDCSNNPIPCGQYQVAQAGSSCTGGDPSFVSTSGGSISYLPWQTRAFDLTSFIGQCVKIEFTVGGCIASQAGHGGYAYLDASCQPMSMTLNGESIPVGQTNNSFCGAATTNTLCAPSGFTYSWTGPGVTGQTGQCINTNSTGTFSVTLGQAGASCFSPVLYSTFNSVPNPTLTPSLTQPVCALPVGTASINIAGGTGPFTYTWSPAAPSNSVNTSLPAGSSYTVSAEDSNGCIGTTTFSVDPYPPAPSYTLNVTPGYSLSCASPSTTITFTNTNSSTNATWAGPLGAITNSNVVVTSPGVYTYTAINSVSTCSLTGTINITGSLNLPVVTSTVTQPSCSLPLGSATVSTSNGTAPYTYSWSPTVTAPTGTVNSNLPPGSTYTVSVTDDLGCVAVNSFSVSPFAGAPQYTLNNSPSLLITCSSPSTTLTFAPTNANTSTTWNGPSGVITGTSTVATGAGTYSYVALNTVSSCSVAGTVVVTTDTVKSNTTYTVTCNGNMINLNATPVATSSVITTWISPTTPTTSLGNPVLAPAVGIYTLALFNQNNGCLTTYTASAIVPPISVATSPSNNILTCTTQTIQATASSTTGVNISWNNGVSSSTVNPYPINANGTYTAIAQVPGGCSSETVITVSTNTVVNVSINPSSTMISCATGSVNLTANSSVGGPYTYSWMPSTPTATGTSYVATSANTYSVIALNTANGCTATTTQAINMQSINASFNASVYDGLMPLPVTFTNTSIGTNPAGTNYTWNFGDGLSLASNDTTVNHLYNQDGLFPVILTATNGFCVDTAMRYIKVDVISLFEVPNVFTPNGDGKNDVFTFKAINMGEIHVIIYDRWGLNMFETTATGNVQWDGKNKGGATVTDGTYFYIIKASGLDGKEYDLKGTINVFQY